MIRDNAARASFLGVNVLRVRLIAFVLAAVFAGVGGVIVASVCIRCVSGIRLLDHLGEGIFMIMLGGLNSFLGPAVGTVILLILNDFATRFTEYYGLTLGIVILLFALGLRRGLLDGLIGLWQRRAALSKANA